MALDDVFELAVRLTAYDITMFNVFHFKDVRGDGSAQHLAQHFAQSAVMTEWKANLASTTRIESVSTTQIYPYVLNQGGWDVNAPGVPFDQPGPPPVTALVVTWTTGVRGKRYRGRSYFSWMRMQYSGSSWGDAARGKVVTVVNSMLSVFGPDGSDPTYRLGVWSRKNGKLDPNTTSPAGFTPVTGATVRSYVCSMGTRRAGHGI